MTKCVVLGGAGFLGSHICEALLRAGHHVRVFEKEGGDKGNVHEFLGKVEWMEGDFTKPDHLAEVVNRMEAVIHCIGTTLPKTSNENPVYDISTNLISTLHLLNAAVEAQVKKIIFLSSGGTVYGIPQKTLISEEHPTEPLCSYGIQKLAIEKYLKIYHDLHGLDYSVMRLSNPYGERQRPMSTQGVIPVFLYKAIREEPIEVWGDGSVVRDYLYVSDVATGVLSTLDYHGRYKIFNIGSGQGFSLLTILEKIEKITGRSVNVVFKPSRPFDVPVNILNVTRAKKELLWSPKIEMEEGLQRTLNFLLHAPDRESY